MSLPFLSPLIILSFHHSYFMRPQPFSMKNLSACAGSWIIYPHALAYDVSYVFKVFKKKLQLQLSLLCKTYQADFQQLR
jgi:hypothetical protein